MVENGKKLAVWGIALQIAPLLAGISIAFTIAYFFLHQDSLNDQFQTTFYILFFLNFAVVFLAMTGTIAGIVLIGLALFAKNYRASWFKTALWIVAVVWLVTGSMGGTAAGILLIIYLATHGHEFTPPQTQAPPSEAEGGTP